MCFSVLVFCVALTVPPQINTLEDIARWYMHRFEALLDMDLPFHKIGIAHLTVPLISSKWNESHLRVLNLFSDQSFEKVFFKAAEKGIGIKLNFDSFGL